MVCVSRYAGGNLADLADREHHRQTASVVADAIAENRETLLRLARQLEGDPDELYAVATEIDASKSLTTLRLSLSLADCIVEYDGTSLDELLVEFIPQHWVDRARCALATVALIEERCMNCEETIADLVALQGELAASISLERPTRE